MVFRFSSGLRLQVLFIRQSKLFIDSDGNTPPTVLRVRRQVAVGLSEAGLGDTAGHT